MGSVSAWAIFPMQDLLGLGAEARMNRPSAAHGNWSWRMPPQPALAAVRDRLVHLVDLFDRNGNPCRHGSVDT
jgi:4-alpha-glucanotransferase